MLIALRVLHVVSELFPFVKTGGLADVAAALPSALVEVGIDVRAVVPGYPAVLDATDSWETVWTDADLFRGGPARLLRASPPALGFSLYALDCPRHFGRLGNPYVDVHGRDYVDNHRRFAALGFAAAAIARGADATFVPNVVHGHDWQAGLATAYLALGPKPRPGLVTTIHNLAYHGAFSADVFPELGLPEDARSMHGVEFYGRISFLKAGLYYADRLATVSPTYAREIQLAKEGVGFEGLLATRARDLTGILNGVDYAIWNPRTDPHLPAPYDPRRLGPKEESKGALRRRLGLPDRGRSLVLGVVSRLTLHKGIDLLLGLGPWLERHDAELVVVGTGDRELEEALRRFATEHPANVAIHLGYDESLAHLVQGGSDAILVPSRSEPCGLTQLYALKYGSLPVVHRVGGLADTVVDLDEAKKTRATGFVFDRAELSSLAGALDRVAAAYADRTRWRRLQQAAMAVDFGWRPAASRYVELYKEAASAGGGQGRVRSRRGGGRGKSAK